MTSKYSNVGLINDYLLSVMYAVGIHHILTPKATETTSKPSLVFSLSIISTFLFNSEVDHIDDVDITKKVFILC